MNSAARDAPVSIGTKAFHDAILKANSMPIEMLRALMTDVPLSRDYRARWKYYGEVTAAAPNP